MPRTKLDKIFDNKFHESQYIPDQTQLDFSSEHFIEDNTNPDKTLYIQNILNDIDTIIVNKFFQYKEVINNKSKRVNKDDINKIYPYVRFRLLKKYPIIDIWNYTSEYFDIDTTRFFDSLEDRFKNELILYLKTNTKLLDNKQMEDLF